MSSSCCCCAQIEQGHVGIVEDLGKFADVLPPGFHCFSLTRSVKGALSLKGQYHTAEVKSITSDQADVKCVLGIMYRVMPESCHLAYYRLNRADVQITNFVVGAVRPLIITKTLDALFLERDELSQIVKQELCEKMAEFGYEILDVLFANLIVEGRVRQSMNEQMTQRYNRELAEVRQNTSNIRQIALSNANVEVERLDGVGTAEARKILASAFTTASHEQAAIASSHDVGSGAQQSATVALKPPSEIEVMAMMLMMQYYDMLRDVKKTMTYFMPLASSSDTLAMAEEEDGRRIQHNGVKAIGSLRGPQRMQ